MIFNLIFYSLKWVLITHIFSILDQTFATYVLFHTRQSVRDCKPAAATVIVYWFRMLSSKNMYNGHPLHVIFIHYKPRIATAIRGL